MNSLGCGSEPIPDTRLIERWLPIAALGEESVRERRSMTALPPIYYLHVWWARRPLVASRAAVLASLLPADVDRGKFLHVLGIHGDPVAAKKRIAVANRMGERLGADAYGYSRAFGYTPDDRDKAWLGENAVNGATVVDPTAGGGSVPFEAVRLGIETVANDLNPVAALIERATIEWPTKYGVAVKSIVKELGSEFTREVRQRLCGVFPDEPRDGHPARRLSLGPDHYLPLLRRARTAVAQLASGTRRNRRPVEAKDWFRPGFRGPHLFVRDCQIQQGTISRDGITWRRHLPLFGLRPRHRW